MGHVSGAASPEETPASGSSSQLRGLQAAAPFPPRIPLLVLMASDGGPEVDRNFIYTTVFPEHLSHAR